MLKRKLVGSCSPWGLIRFFTNVYFEREREEKERACKQGRGRMGESQAGSILSMQSLMQGSVSRTMRS